MSIIGDLNGDLKQIPSALVDYENELDQVKEILNMEGKRLETLNRENPSWFYYFAEKRSELKHLLEYVETDLDRIHAKLYRVFNEKHSIDLSHSAIEKYIKCEPEYVLRKQIYAEVKEIFDKFESVVKAFEQRAFQLRNITQLRVESLENIEL